MFSDIKNNRILFGVIAMIYDDNETMRNMVCDTFCGELRESTLDFFNFLNDDSMKFERLSGYWKDQFYWMVKYKERCLCYILINGTGDEKQFAPLTIWSDDSGSDWYKNYPLSDKLKESAIKNIDYCVHCGSCSGGIRKTIFKEQFDNVCKTTFRFTNPTPIEFELIKELIAARKMDINEQFYEKM